MHNAGSCVRFTSLVQLEPWFPSRRANDLLTATAFSGLFRGELTIFGRDC